ncbi:MAG: 16S rRNA (adenine(1518)-N(6)/adenine(1519)-N(6))-dimethyltransferase RsmA [Candidatus Berkelbacteria bacterium]
MNKAQLIQFLRANEIWAKRTMGQNFLVDNEVLDKIIAAAGISSSDTVLEIGPGLGVLTEGLSEKANKVIAIEKDDKLTEMLESKFSGTNVEILHQDALEFDPTDLGEYKLVANIPYNITSLIIRKFLETANKPERLILMVQKEVAERITAKPGDMSLLSVSVQFYAQVEIITLVKNTSFYPSPKIDSAVIKISPKELSKGINEKEFFRIVKFGFAAKRKTLENNLSAGMHITKEDASGIIKAAGLEARIRAEALTIENWKKLYDLVTRRENERGEEQAT